MHVRTTCNRDCPDACGMVAEIRDGRVASLRGDSEHPITRGYLCQRTNRFLERQYHPGRIVRPLLRHGERQVEIPLDEALDLAAERLLQIRRESGAAAILPFRLGGSLGLLKELTDHFFDLFGPTSVKRGDVCSGAGEAAQLLDFGHLDSHDPRDLLHARHVINWGRNMAVSSVHMLPIVREARERGATVTVIDPVHTRTAEMADRHLQVRPGGDIALALAVGRRMFERDRGLAGRAGCDHVDGFRALCFSRSLEELLAACDLGAADVEGLVDALQDGPTTILVGWGLQRRRYGGATVRVLDALGALSGNLGRAGGGVHFTTVRRRPFNFSFRRRQAAPREFLEPRLAQEILAAKDPPVRCLWVTCANPVAMLPDSARMAEAMEKTEFTVVVDSHPTDTTRRATLVLPATTMLEDDDLLGSYGHHYVGVSRPVVPPPPGVLTDLELVQALARRVGLGAPLEGSAREWKERLLQGSTLRLEDLEAGAQQACAPGVLFSEGVRTGSGRVNLVHELPSEAVGADAVEDFPLWLFSNSVAQAQASQWAVDLPEGPMPATVHPRAACGLRDGDEATVVSPVASLRVRLVHDARQRDDVVLLPKGGHLDRGHAANRLIAADLTDLGLGAAYLDTRVRLEP